MDREVPDQISTRIVSQRELRVDGISFEWWAVGEQPAFVTVRARWFGSVTEPTTGDVAELAAVLARKLIAQHRARPAKKPVRAKTPSLTVLEKPGWFEPGSTDFSSTIF